MTKLRIKEILKEKNVTGIALANALGVTKEWVYKITSGNSNPPLKRLQEISDYLNVDIRQLFDSENQNADIRCPHCGKTIEVKVANPKE
jgi:transcriptional regulator with XRE-family HTH domain